MPDQLPASRRPDRRGRHGLTRRRAGALALFCVISAYVFASAATARPSAPITALNATDFRPVVVPPRPTPASDTTGVDERITAVETGERILDFAGRDRSSAVGRPTPAQRNVAKSVAKAQGIRLTGHHASGTATWYCKTGVSVCHHDYPGGMYAAAGGPLRVGDWRGRRVQVCGGGRCIIVTLIDWCACGNGHIIDLYSDAFQRLTPLSSGGLRVKVSW